MILQFIIRSISLHILFVVILNRYIPHPAMQIFVCGAAMVALTSAQQYHQDPKTAAIISEQRYQSGDGQFGAAYTQEDGTDFKEETDADGTRHGSYSYIDPNGQKKTVSYTAGKNG